jgi:hypothetical protein
MMIDQWIIRVKKHTFSDKTFASQLDTSWLGHANADSSAHLICIILGFPLKPSNHPILAHSSIFEHRNTEKNGPIPHRLLHSMLGKNVSEESLPAISGSEMGCTR